MTGIRGHQTRQRKLEYQPPTGRKPGRWTVGWHGTHNKGGFSHGPSPSAIALADQLHDATFGAQATKLAEAEWHKAHRRESE